MKVRNAIALVYVLAFIYTNIFASFASTFLILSGFMFLMGLNGMIVTSKLYYGESLDNLPQQIVAITAGIAIVILQAFYFGFYLGLVGWIPIYFDILIQSSRFYITISFLVITLLSIAIGPPIRKSLIALRNHLQSADDIETNFSY